MKAPLSKRVKKILADRNLSRKLMQAIIAEREGDQSKSAILVDGEEFRLVRVSAVHKNR